MLDPASPGLINRSVLVSSDRTLVLSEKVPLGKFQSSDPKPDGLHILIPFVVVLHKEAKNFFQNPHPEN